MAGAAAVQNALLRRPRTTSAAVRVLTAPVVRRAVAGTWSIYWNGLADGARPRPSAWTARAVQVLAGRLAGQPITPQAAPATHAAHAIADAAYRRTRQPPRR